MIKRHFSPIRFSPSDSRGELVSKLNELSRQFENRDDQVVSVDEPDSVDCIVCDGGRLHVDRNAKLSSILARIGRAERVLGDGFTNERLVVGNAAGNLESAAGLQWDGAALAIGGTFSANTGSTIGNLTLANGSITDSSGAISFNDENLSTSGNISAGTLTLAGGSITDSTGAISFGNENLSTTGTLGCGTITCSGLLNIAAGSAPAPAIYFGDSDTGIYAPGANQVAISTSGTQRAWFTSVGAQLTALGLGNLPNAWVNYQSRLSIYDEAYSFTNDRAEIVARLIKTGGGSNSADDWFAILMNLAYDQAGGEIGTWNALNLRLVHDDGSVGSATSSKAISSYVAFLDLNGGTVYGDAYAARYDIDQEVAHTITGDVYGAIVNLDLDGTVSGTTYGVYIYDGSNVNYSIYTVNSAPCRFGGDLRIASDSNGLVLGAGDDMDVYYDGTNGNIRTDLVAASDLRIDCGANKTIELQTPVYKDENFSGFAAGATANIPDAIAWDGGSIYVRGFDGGATTEQLFAGAELQHDYQEGTDLVFHIHWAPTTAGAGNVKWQLDYTIERDGTGTLASGTLSVVDAADGTAWLPTRTDIGTVTGTTFQIGDQIQVRLYRDPTDGDDTYAGDAALAFTFGYHYQVNTLGSRQIGTK